MSKLPEANEIHECLVTLEDVVETLLGNEILDEGDKVEDMRQLARQLWAKRAERMGIDSSMR